MQLLELLCQGRIEEFNSSRGRHAAPDLFGADLAGLDLSGADLSGAILEKADLSGARLCKAILANANLSGADLTGADLTGVIAIKARWRDAFLGDAVLDEAEMSGADLHEADLTGARGRGTRWVRARMKDAILTRTCLPDADFSNCNLSGAKLDCAELARGRFLEAVLVEALLDGGSFIGADFTDARLTRVSARKTSFESAILHGADLTGACLEGALFEGADLSRADLSGADLRETNLCCADLRETGLTDVDLSSANTQGVVLASPVVQRAEVSAAPAPPLRFSEISTSLSGDVLGVLWENDDAENETRYRCAAIDVDGSWNRQSPVLFETAALVSARALLASGPGFRAILFVERAGGLSCQITEISPLGDVGASRNLQLDYVPAVVPVFLPWEDGFLVLGMSRSGPTVHIHRFNGVVMDLVARERVATARGFVGAREPVLLCKGGVVIPIGEQGLGKPAAFPDGFPGRKGEACQVQDGILLAWLPRSAPGLHHCVTAPGRKPVLERLGGKRGVSSMDMLRLGDDVLIAYVQEGRSLMDPSELMGVWLPDGVPFSILPGTNLDVDEVTLVPGGPTPLLVATTLGGGLVIIEVSKGDKGGRREPSAGHGGPEGRLLASYT